MELWRDEALAANGIWDADHNNVDIQCMSNMKILIRFSERELGLIPLSNSVNGPKATDVGTICSSRKTEKVLVILCRDIIG